VVSIANPIESIHRGQTFEFILQLYPAPVKTVEILTESSSPLLIPGAERTWFGIEQDVANAIFYVPAGGDVGPANIIFRSRTKRDYSGPDCQDLSITVNVQGEISSNVSSVVGKGLTYQFEVVISPPALYHTMISIDTLGQGQAPSSVNIEVGQNYAVFDFTVTSDSGTQGCIQFEGTYYEATQACYTVIGSITTTIPENVNTFAVETYSVSITPAAPAGGVAMTLTSSANVQVTPSLFFEEGDSYETFQIVGVDTLVGPAWVEFSAPGYETLRVQFNVYEVDCAIGYTISQDGNTCLNCPGAVYGAQCSYAGECSYSLFSHLLARCTCNDGYFGPICEFTGEPSDYPNVDIVPIDSTGTVITTKKLPLTFSSTFSVPPGLLQDGFSGQGVVYIIPYSEGAFINPYEVAPSVEGDEVTVLGTGFTLEVSAWDNTYVQTLRPPILARFVFHPLKVSQGDFLEAVLYYFDADAGSWVPATSVCSAQYRFVTADLLTLTYSTNLCRAGQYQFFVVAPEPFHKIVVDPQPDNEVYIEEYFIADLYLTGTGLGGDQPPLPPQPVFREEFIASPGKLSPPKVNYLYESASSANALFVSVGALLLALLLSL